MQVYVNGRAHPLAEPTTMASLLERLAPQPPYAVARNGELVPRGSYTQCVVNPGDAIDIVQPVAGG
jgi:sulfur carrier protein